MYPWRFVLCSPLLVVLDPLIALIELLIDATTPMALRVLRNRIAAVYRKPDLEANLRACRDLIERECHTQAIEWLDRAGWDMQPYFFGARHKLFPSAHLYTYFADRDATWEAIRWSLREMFDAQENPEIIDNPEVELDGLS